MSQVTWIISKNLTVRKDLVMHISDITNTFAQTKNNPRNQWFLGLFVTRIKREAVSFRNVVVLK